MKQAKRILRIGIARLPDDDPDTSWLGEYSSKRTSEFSIDRAHSEACAVNNQAGYDKLESVFQHLYGARVHLQNEDRQLNALSEWYQGLSDAEDLVNNLMADFLDCDCEKHLNSSEYRYFNPGSTTEPFDVNASWIPADVPDKEAYWRAAMHQNAEQDYARMEALNNGQWEFIGIRACADVTIGNTRQSIYSGGLWGIESDSEASYLKEVESEELASLRETLYELGFSKRAIATAVKERMDA